MQPVDKLGTPIIVGCYIAYGHALGRCAGLRVGKVLAIKHVIPSEYSSKDSEYHFTVIGVDDDWSHKPAELCTRKGTLQFPDRILVLTDVPEPYKGLLRSYES